MGRDELFALVVLARFLVPLAECEFIMDNKGVYKAYVGEPTSGPTAQTVTYVEQKFKLMYEKTLILKVWCMPTHQKALACSI